MPEFTPQPPEPKKAPDWRVIAATTVASTMLMGGGIGVGSMDQRLRAVEIQSAGIESSLVAQTKAIDDLKELMREILRENRGHPCSP